MTKREIVFMACRLMAVYQIMSSIPELSRYLSNFDYLSSYSISASSLKSLTINFNGVPATPWQLVVLLIFRLLPIISPWVGAALLWILAREIAVRLFDNEPEAITEGPIFAFGAEARAVAFAIVGIFFLTQDLTHLGLLLLTWIWDLVRWTQPRAPFNSSDFFYWSWLVRIPISLWLIFGLRGLAGLWRLAQEKGIAPTARASGK